jgi:hypothetical protein
MSEPSKIPALIHLAMSGAPFPVLVSTSKAKDPVGHEPVIEPACPRQRTS